MPPIKPLSAGRVMVRASAVLVPLATVLGCGGDDAVDLPQPTAIAIVAGDNQVAPAGARLPQAFAVSVTASDGAPVPRAQVVWSVVQGSGASLSDTLTLADGLGRAEVWLTLGTAPASYQVRATLVVNSQLAVTLDATASAPPVITSVGPDPFSGGDLITILGAGFSPSTVVEIGGVASPTSPGVPVGDVVEAIVPPCLTPGSVAVVAVEGTARSNTVFATSLGPQDSLQLAVGRHHAIAPGEVDGCVVFPAAGPNGAEYLFAAQLAGGIAGDTLRFELRGDLAAAAPAVMLPARRAEELPFAVRFHDRMLERGREFARLPRPPEPIRASQAVIASVEVGERRKFRVCNKLECTTIDDFPQITAEAKYVGEHALIYHDLDAPESGGLTPDDFAELGRIFDDDIYEVVTRAFGVESDVDLNGRVVILMTPIVNGLTPAAQCAQSIITGFFFPIDVDPAFEKDARSNKGEVFYSMTADPNGVRGCDVPTDRVRKQVPVTFVHELQHMISYNQHVLVRSGQTEQVWLNEGMSHIAEELVALHFAALDNSVAFSRFVAGDLLNSYRFLENTEGQFAFYADGTGSLSERGANWLFLRWMADHLGEAVLRRMSETSLTGSTNVATAAGEPFDRLAAQWFTANYVSDLPDLITDARLQYLSWNFRAVYRLFNDQLPGQFPRLFPIDPTLSNGGAFAVTGKLHSGSGAYLIVTLEPNQAGFSVRFTGQNGEPLPEAKKPRLNVIRIR